jgi:Recombinase
VFLASYTRQNEGLSQEQSPWRLGEQDTCVKFRDLAKQFQDRMQQKAVARKTEKGLRRYRNSGEVRFPRIYGYHETSGGVEVVENEAKCVRIIIGMLALGRSPEQVKKEMDKRDERNRSGDRFCEDEILRMLKPVYMGMILGASGKMVPSKHYPALVSPEIWKKASKAVKRLTEGSKSAPLIIGERVSLTSTSRKAWLDTKWHSLALP